ncbi:MAG: M14 family metallocarboxypeptidase [Verrucomicrobia bacterium]|nr:M14 family metallocarboxypeptidase [Verrucomicrobiota bacterium]
MRHKRYGQAPEAASRSDFALCAAWRGGYESAVQRLGKNHGGYFGEAIDIRAVARECAATARENGWAVEEFFTGKDFNLHAFTRPAISNLQSPISNLNIYISAGIHGDEPAGPLAVRRLLRDNAWPDNAALWLCPCLNPGGFALGRRENADGLDLNRQYHAPRAVESRAHVAWLARQPRFDLCLCLHEDWEAHGFYLYELNLDNLPSLAGAMMEKVSAVCPVDNSEVIEGRAAAGGVIRPSADPLTRPEWPEAFYLLQNKTRLSYTLEAPSDFSLATRVNALVAATNAAVRKFTSL